MLQECTEQAIDFFLFQQYSKILDVWRASQGLLESHRVKRRIASFSNARALVTLQTSLG
jgi:hypothetical protein